MGLDNHCNLKEIMCQWFSDFNMHQNHLKSLVKHRLLLLPRIFWFFGSGVGPRIGIFNKFSSNAKAASLGALLWELLIWANDHQKMLKLLDELSMGNYIIRLTSPESVAQFFTRPSSLEPWYRKYGPTNSCIGFTLSQCRNTTSHSLIQLSESEPVF